MTKKDQHTSKLLNLTSKEICIYNDSNSIIARLPSRGELRIRTSDHTHYPLHHIHYYDSATETEAGIPISPAKIINLDQQSPGYASLDCLTSDDDSIVVSLPVAEFLMSKNKKMQVVPQIFVVDTSDNSLIYNTETSIGIKRLEWYIQ